MQRADANILKYATRYRQAVNGSDMVKYEQTLEHQYTAGADGETIAVIPGLIGVRVIQVEREIKPIYDSDYAWNSNSGQLTLLNGVSMAYGETLFILYALTVVE